MDIVVTIPKSEYRNDDKETELYKTGEYEQFWTLNRMPKNLSEGDRVYFVKHGQVDSSMKVIRIEKDSSTRCEVTGREWKGNCQLFLSDLQEESNEINVKGFRGFRYRWWEVGDTM